ncbi:MAG: FeoB small GTPase domain-containing protein [bacterium]|nr:FeoB small GTPase domain-containing protein [bacterium]
MGSGCSRCINTGRSSSQSSGEDLRVNDSDYVVALAGNPNTGKSTVFNALTGLKQRTGNWPGKTVTRAEGTTLHEGKRYKLVDLPGTYSLLSTSQDEEIARDFILFGDPHATVVVVDSTCLERNLNLVLQVLEITDRVVVCLNLMDEAARKGIRVDDASLARDLGVPVVPTVARSGKGLGRLIETVSRLVGGEIQTSPHRLSLDAHLSRAVEGLRPLIERIVPGLPNTQWIALRLLDGDERIREALRNGELAHRASLPLHEDGVSLAPA